MFEIFYNFYGLNQDIFLFINRIANINTLIAYFFKIISYCFNIKNFAIIYFLYSIYFCIQLKKARPIAEKEKFFWPIYNRLIEVGIIYTLFGLVFTTLKYLTNLPRPFCSLPLNSFTTIIDISTERCLSSFPSSHTGLSILVSYLIWPHANNLSKFLIGSLIILVSISRLVLAMHYPADIIYGALITIIIIKIGEYIYKVFVNNVIKYCGNLVVKYF